MRAELRTLQLTESTAPDEELALGFFDAVSRGFHAGRAKRSTAQTWLGHARRDASTLRGAWLPEGAYGAGPMPVATFLSFDKTLNAGAAELPLRMITDVTVSPAHRRQGWLRRLMTADLDDAVERGVPVAALTVSEATIYGRFGFGPATFSADLEVDTSRRFDLPGFVDPGRVEVVEPDVAWPAVAEDFARFHRQVRGSVDRPSIYEPILRGELTFELEEGNDRLRAAVHLGPGGTPDGHVLYEVHEAGDPATVRIRDLVATDPAVHLALWRFVADIDLADRATLRRTPVDDPLRWALGDAFCYRTAGIWEHIWVRVLDPVAALWARPWRGDGAVVLGVADPMGYAEGRYLVEVRDGAVEVTASRREADLELGVDVLGSLLLGGAGVPALAAAGRLRGDAKAVDDFARMAQLPTAPFSATSF